MTTPEKAISGFPEATVIAETDPLLGNVAGSTKRIPIDVARTRLNNSDQDITGDVEVSGSHKAASYEGNGALITSVTSSGVGGNSSETSLSLICNSANGTPAAKIVGSKFSQDLFEADENGFGLKTGIPYTHDDDAIPFNKDTDHQGNEILRSKSLLDQQIDPYYYFDGVADYITVADNININDGTGDFTKIILARFYETPAASRQFYAKFTGGVGFDVRHQDDGKILWRVDDNTTDSTIESDSSVSEGVHIIALGADRDGNMTMDVDGVPQSDTATCPPLTITNAADLYLGSSTAAATFAKIGILGVWNFNRLLTAAERKTFSSNPQKAIDWADIGGSNVAQNVSNCVNGASVAYDTFANGTPTGFDAIKTTTGAGTAEAGTAAEITYVAGKQYAVIYDQVQNSGVLPDIDIALSLGGAKISDEGSQTSVAGLNNILVFTANQTATGVLQWQSATGDLSDFEVTDIDIHQLGATLVLEGKNASPQQIKDSANGLIGVVTTAELCNKAENQQYKDEYPTDSAVDTIADNDAFDVPVETAFLELWLNVTTLEAGTTIRMGTSDGGEQVVVDSIAPQSVGLHKLTVLPNSFAAGDTLYIGSDTGAAWSALRAKLYVRYNQVKNLG